MSKNIPGIFIENICVYYDFNSIYAFFRLRSKCYCSKTIIVVFIQMNFQGKYA